MLQITRRQKELLDYLDRYRRTYYCSPVYREMAEHFGWSSLRSASVHLSALAKKGYVTPIVSATGVARGYRLTSRGQAARRGVSAPRKGQSDTRIKGDTNRV